jgi:hypothetical protein
VFRHGFSEQVTCPEEQEQVLHPSLQENESPSLYVSPSYSQVFDPPQAIFVQETCPEEQEQVLHPSLQGIESPSLYILPSYSQVPVQSLFVHTTVPAEQEH